MKNPQSHGFVVWFTGLPCSGKTTLARRLCRQLRAHGLSAELLDGDELRQSLSPDLGFTREDREEHGRRVVLAAADFVRQGRPVVVSLVSPYHSMRRHARETLQPFFETYLDCPLAVCESRDVKGMYRLARAGSVRRFTGVSDQYEPPKHPEIILQTNQMKPQACVEQILKCLTRAGLLQTKYTVSPAARL